MIMIRVSQGLGNQLFQFAFGECLKQKEGVDVCYDTSFIASKISGRKMRSVNDIFRNPFNIATLHDVRKFSGRIIFKVPFVYSMLMQNENLFQLMNGVTWKHRNKKKCVWVQEPDYWDISNAFVESILNMKILKGRNYYFNGFWESVQYIKKYRKYLQERFEIKIEENLKNDTYKTIIEEESVSIHIRRGDYVTKSNDDIYFNLCGETYYKEAIEIIKKNVVNPLFVVFSDDISFARILLKDEENCIYVEGNKDYEDLYLMSNCKHNIVANSTFSFWGAFLNKYDSQYVVAPKVHYMKKINGNWIKVMFPVLTIWDGIDN